MLCRTLLLVILFASGTVTAAIQRMGLVAGSSATIAARGSGSLPSRCMDEHDEPPSTDTNYSAVLTPDARNSVVVDHAGRQLTLQQAIKDKVLKITGVTQIPDVAPGMEIEAEISRLRIVNLTDKPIRVRVDQGVVLGTAAHNPLSHKGFERLLDEGLEQEDLWRRQMEMQRQLSELDQTERGDIRRLSTDRMRLFAVTKSADTMEITLPDTTVRLNQADWGAIKDGKRLSEGHPLSRELAQHRGSHFVLYTNHADLKSLSTKFADSKQAAEQLVLSLQKSYPEVKIYRDPYSDRTEKAAKDLTAATLRSPEELLVVIAGDSFGVTDWKIIQNMQEALVGGGLKGGNIRVVEQATIKQNAGLAEGKKAIVVITGHMDAKLRQFVKALGEAGYFKDKFVILNACNEGATVDVASEICREYGAVGTFYYDGKISAFSVDSLMENLVKNLKAGANTNLVDMLRRTVQSVKLNGAWTISMLDRATDRCGLYLYRAAGA